MKTLIITRHAKSDWGNLSQHDYERPLNERGEKDAPVMGRRLSGRMANIDHILSSSAKRAEQTACLIAPEINYQPEKIEWSKDLYHAPALKILQQVEGLDNRHQIVMIVCHNPGITHFVNMQTNFFTDNVPTCGMVAFDADIDHWKDFEQAAKTLRFYDFPKNQ